MKVTNWKDIAELIGIAAIVASLIFVGVQMRQDRQIAEAQIFAEFGESHTAWVDLVTTNAAVWVRGLNGDDLSDTETAQFDALAAGYWVQQRSKYLRSTRLAGRPDFIVVDTANFIYQHKGLRHWYKKWLDHSERRDGNLASPNQHPFLVGIDETLDGLASGEITPIPNKSYMPNN